MKLGPATAVIAASDLKGMTFFYRDVLGLTTLRETPDFVCFEEGVILVPQTWGFTPRYVPSPVAVRFYVADLATTHHDLVSRGVTLLAGPTDSETYSYAAIADLEGNCIELVQIRQCSAAEAAPLDTVIIGGLVPADGQLGEGLITGTFESANIGMLVRMEEDFAQFVLRKLPGWNVPSDWELRTSTGTVINNEYPLGERPTLTHVALMTSCAQAGFRAAALGIKELLRPSSADLALLRSARTICLSTTYITNQRVLNILVERVLGFEVPIIVGGPLLGTDESFERLLGTIRYFVIGDGERALPDVLRHVKGEPLSGQVQFEERTGSLIVRALATRRANSAHVHDHNSFDATGGLDLESYPTPDWRLVNFPEGAVPVIEYESVRGCPYRCEFCNYPFLFGDSGFRVKSAQRIFEDWRFYVQETGIRNISCLDSLFTIPPKRLRQLCRLLIESRLGIRWNCFARVDDLANDELVALMAEGGCRNVSVGFESGNQEILNNMNKKVRLDHSYQAIQNCRRHGIIVSGLFVVGFPGETERTARDTTQFIINTNPDGYALFCMSYFSPLAKMPILEPAQRQRYGLTLDEHEVYVQNPSWKHATMDCLKALELTEQMIHEIGRSSCSGVFLERFNPAMLQMTYSDLDYRTCQQIIALLRVIERGMYAKDALESDRIRQTIDPYFRQGVPVNGYGDLQRRSKIPAGLHVSD